jgi:two-component system, OmpR family, response regulator
LDGAVTGKMRILVVDDEPAITEVVATVLRYEGFDVESADDGAVALRSIPTFRPDLLILDVQMPQMDGFEVQRRLAAERSRVPVLFLTARDSLEDKVRGLTMGADDYLTKPFSLEELVARVRAVLRRAGATPSAEQRLRYSDLEMDVDTHEVWRGGKQIELTLTEFSLLRYLVINAPSVVSKAQILDHVWDYDFEGDFNVVETFISYLRKKVDIHGDPLIRTVRGVGYGLRTMPR